MQQNTGGDSEWGGNVRSNTLEETHKLGRNCGGITPEETRCGAKTLAATLTRGWECWQ